MTSEHPNLPTVAVVKGQLAVLGGGEGHYTASDGHDKASKTSMHELLSLKGLLKFKLFQLEIFDGKDWQPFSVLNPGRIFAASVSVPKELLPDCQFEPNLGIHRYYQDRTAKSLESELWMCNGGELIKPDTKVHKSGTNTRLPHFVAMPCSTFLFKFVFSHPDKLVHYSWLQLPTHTPSTSRHEAKNLHGKTEKEEEDFVDMPTKTQPSYIEKIYGGVLNALPPRMEACWRCKLHEV